MWRVIAHYLSSCDPKAPPSSWSSNWQWKGRHSTSTPASTLRGGRKGRVPRVVHLCEGQRPLPGASNKLFATCGGWIYWQLDGLREAQIAGKHYFWVCLWGCFWKTLVDWITESRSPSPLWVGIIQSTEGPRRAKMWREDRLALSVWAGIWISPCP